jgi:hypothetical protein
VDAIEKKILFSQAKERISGRKRDGGGISSLLKYGLDYINADINDIHTGNPSSHTLTIIPPSFAVISRE